LFFDDDTFANTHEWTSREVVPQQPAIQRLRSADFPYSYRLAAGGEILAAPRLASLPDDAEAEKRSFSSFGVEALLQVPITVSGETIGLIGFNHFDAVETWSDELVHVVQRVAHVIGATLLRLRATQTRQLAFDEIRRVDELKDAFVAHVSHELRTPLHAILGFAELLNVGDQTPHASEAIHQIRSNGAALLTMVEDLIALSQIDSDPSIDVPLGPLVKSLLEPIEQVAASHRVSIAVSDDVHGVVVHDDPERLRQVLYCAVSSGLRAIGDHGTVTIAAEQFDDAAMVRIGLTSVAGVTAERVVLPMATALIEGHGAIEIRDDDGNVEIAVRFGQMARP
jgi:signal transduction histidine kinase